MSVFPQYQEWEGVVPEPTQNAFAAALGSYVQEHAIDLWERESFDWRHLFADRRQALYDIANSTGDSPIEQILAGWLAWLDGEYLGLVSGAGADWWFELGQDDADTENPALGRDELFFGLMPQARVGRYRVDFLILAHGPGGERRIAVECDGHEWHERTKDQAARDKLRDRELLLAGVPVMRFTGSEIWRDPGACYRHIQQAALAACWEVANR